MTTPFFHWIKILNLFLSFSFSYVQHQILVKIVPVPLPSEYAQILIIFHVSVAVILVHLLPDILPFFFQSILSMATEVILFKEDRSYLVSAQNPLMS